MTVHLFRSCSQRAKFWSNLESIEQCLAPVIADLVGLRVDVASVIGVLQVSSSMARCRAVLALSSMSF